MLATNGYEDSELLDPLSALRDAGHEVHVIAPGDGINDGSIEGKNGIALGFNYIKKLNTNCKFLWMKNPKCYNEDGSKKTYAQLYNGNKSTDIKTALALALINKASTDAWDQDSDK